MMKKGVFLTFEGIDGSGKTTLAKRLVPWLEARNIGVDYVSSAGYVPIDRVTSELLQDKSVYDPYAHLFLSFANNRILVKSVVEPGIAMGKVVIVERYYHSIIAYSLPLGIPFDWMIQISSALIEPDKIIYCDVTVETALTRKSHKIEDVEVGFKLAQSLPMAFQDYQAKVKHAYQQMIERAPDRFIIVPSEGSVETMTDFLFSKLQDVLLI